MEKIFESAFFIKLQNLAEKLGNNKAINAIQGALMSSMGIIMVGAVFQMAAVIPVNLGWMAQDGVLYNTFYSVYNLTMNLLSLWFIFQLGYNYAKALKLNPMTGALNSTIAFILVASVGHVTGNMESLTTSFLGGTGLFVAILVGLVSVKVLNFFVKRNIIIKMPDVVPPFLADGFSGMLPLLANTILWVIVSAGIRQLTGVTLAELMVGLLSQPLSMLTGFGGMLVIGVFVGLLWSFGIHGTMMAYVAVMPILLDVTTKNAAAFQAGGVAALQYYPVLLFGGIAMAGGTGNTIGAAIYGAFFAKSEQIKAVGKAGLVPGIFNINEPITFGYPIMYNPILVVPYVLNIVVAMVILHIAYTMGWIIPGYINVGSVLPIGVAEYLSTLNFGNVIAAFVVVIVTTLIWIPFMRIYDNQLYKKEQEELENEANA